MTSFADSPRFQMIEMHSRSIREAFMIKYPFRLNDFVYQMSEFMEERTRLSPSKLHIDARKTRREDFILIIRAESEMKIVPRKRSCEFNGLV